LVLEHLGPAALAGDTMSLYDCFQLALDVAEKALLAKLGAMELPEPAMLTHGAIYTTEKPWYTADQLRQAYAQGAAAQLAERPSAFTDADHMSIFVSEDIAKDCGATIELYTRREAK
jgi:hypothetical protein